MFIIKYLNEFKYNFGFGNYLSMYLYTYNKIVYVCVSVNVHCCKKTVPRIRATKFHVNSETPMCAPEIWIFEFFYKFSFCQINIVLYYKTEKKFYAPVCVHATLKRRGLQLWIWYRDTRNIFWDPRSDFFKNLKLIENQVKK